MKSKASDFDFVQIFGISFNFVYGQYAKMNEFDTKSKIEIENFQYHKYLFNNIVHYETDYTALFITLVSLFLMILNF
jgi:hypothetical protein